MSKLSHVTLQEIVYYNKEVQTKDTSFEPPPPSEDEIRTKIIEELEEIEKQRKAHEEEEKLKIEIEKKKEAKLWGNFIYLIKKIFFIYILIIY